MDWNLWLCFVGINFVLIEALTNFNNVDSERLIKYLHRKNYQNPLSKPVLRINPPIKSYNIIGRDKDGKPIYAVVDMDIVIGRPYVPPKKRPLTYHGNDKWGYLRMSKKHRSPKSISYEEMSDKTNDAIDDDDDDDDDDDYQDDKKLKPGESLIQLNDNNLASAGRFPREKSSLVYGNLENLGITYGKSNDRYEYSDFRKSNNLVDLFKIAIPKSRSGSKKLLVIEIIPRKIRNPFLEMIKPKLKDDEENNASEIQDEFDDGDTAGTAYRRYKDSKFRKRDNYASDWKSDKASSESSEESSSGTDSSSEKNAGNPFTLYKGKYRQNWMWNHKMDGDHLNINPYSPLFTDQTLTGEDLLFGRKWWYFNQDDYKPMG